MSQANFATSYDAEAKGITITIMLILPVIALVTGSVVVGVGFAATLFLIWSWAPTRYSIESGFLVVHRFIGNARIATSSIRNVAIATPQDIDDIVRVSGSCGLFGYYGKFRSPKLGKSTWYMTNQRHAVVVTTDSGTLLFSPDDVDGFLAWVCPSGQRPASRFTPPPIEVKSRNFTMWVVPGIVLLATIFVIGAMFYFPGLPSYTLTNDRLMIQDKFYPVTLSANSIDLKNARIVDFNDDPDWQPITRSNGFSNARYHSGLFKLADGREIRMYRADSKRLILLPPKTDGDPVLFETKDPERFLAEIQQKWGNGS